MYDNVCSLPLPSDLFTLAIHPVNPIIFVGLASGHVHAYRLPSQDDSATASGPEASKPKVNGANSTKPSLVRRVSDASDTPSENGFGTVECLWKTRRHKGSCRALALNSDGSILYSAGTDGLVKAARTDTGQVASKVIVPNAPKDEPSTLLALNPQALLLGTDEGKIHLFDLSQNASIISAKPAKTFRPHATKDEPNNTESITSMTRLAPTVASTSGASRQFVSTAGSTLAVTDVHRGTISVSIDQGDLLLSTAVKAAPASSVTGEKRKADQINAKPAAQDRIFLGTDAGVVSVWDRSKLDDYMGMVAVNRSNVEDDGGTIDCLAVVERDKGARGPITVAAGLGSGAVRLFQLQGKSGKVVEEVMHDDQGFEGVTALGFESEGRMISGGGQIVKVWYDNGVEGALEESSEEEEDSDDEEEDSDAEDPSDEDETEEEEESAEEEEEEEGDDSSSEEDRKRRKRKRGKDTFTKRHTDSHGITAFSGLD